MDRFSNFADQKIEDHESAVDAPTDPLSRAQVLADCRTMLAVLDAQLEDLEGVATTLKATRLRWQSRIDMLEEGSCVVVADRAAKGAVKQAVIDELRRSPDGIRARRIATNLQRSGRPGNMQSINLVLSRLKREGRVTTIRGEWQLLID